jgi:hypothetical protein
MRSLKGKRDVVAPISAPYTNLSVHKNEIDLELSLTMLQIVAIPVAEIVSVPGPWYSTMAPVPPLTVKIPATLRIMSKLELDNGPQMYN